ncbi:GPR1/FUN34/yaaH family-domain-containing protein [Schizophyllum amplum]|uniref:GPR1/FUN34/yaaH family-domain-containing protein n=1 Tax=Schizophyllum amplum TaxID=97359 RepID=A0A550CFS5_9AGAR|nr:GPR1/FUN34/yaaH family-domain-containing protein [Auriculariopsis ampla]
MSSIHDLEKNETEHIEVARLPPSMLAVAPLSPPNPSILGLWAFALTTFVLSFYNANVRGVTTPNAIVGLALFTGGVAQFTGGVWEFIVHNTFGGTAFVMYGCFWMSYAAILLPGTGIAAAYEDPVMLGNALGVFLTGWALLTLMFLVVALRKNLALVSVFGLLFTTFVLLAAAEFSGTASVGKAGGYVGILTAFAAFYTGFAGLLAGEPNPLFRLPVGPL